MHKDVRVKFSTRLEQNIFLFFHHFKNCLAIQEVFEETSGEELARWPRTTCWPRYLVPETCFPAAAALLLLLNLVLSARLGWTLSDQATAAVPLPGKQMSISDRDRDGISIFAPSGEILPLHCFSYIGSHDMTNPTHHQ